MKNYGLIIKEQNPEEYILGGGDLPKVLLQPDGQWDAYLPGEEFQRQNGVETQNCTGYASLHAIVTLLKRKYNLDANYSERALAIMANTDPLRGNDPQVVLETIRNSGVLDEMVLPFSPDVRTLAFYFSPKPLLQWMLDQAKGWLDTWFYGHEWVFYKTVKLADKQARLIEALQYSPVNVSVYAWVQGPDGKYIKPDGEQDNHLTMLYGYKKGEYWKVFDSYDSTHKQLAWDYNFDIAKRHHLEKKGPPPTQSEKWTFYWVLQQLWATLNLLVAHGELASAAPEIVTPDPVPPPVQPIEWTRDRLISVAKNVCHNLNFTHQDQAEMLATIHAESGWSIHALNPKVGNYPNGSRDYGVCQFNTSDTGAGWYCKLITPHQAVNDPEFAITLMAKQWNKGRKMDWNARKNGLYLKYLSLYL